MGQGHNLGHSRKKVESDLSSNTKKMFQIPPTMHDPENQNVLTFDQIHNHKLADREGSPPDPQFAVAGASGIWEVRKKIEAIGNVID